MKDPLLSVGDLSLFLNQFRRQLFCEWYVNQESTSLPMTKWKSYPDQG